MYIVIVIIATALLLVGNELWSRRHQTHGELSRKFIHITVGCMVAFWPWWLTWQQIEWLSLTFLVGIIISRQLGLFQAIHSVQRPTWGELYFAVSAGGIALMTHDKWIYGVALLQMSLADGLAAITGIKYGKGQAYKVFGHDKSLVGTLTFFIVSLTLLIGYSAASGAELSFASLIIIGSLATVIENLAIAGLDNLLVPLLVAVALRSLT